MPTTVKSPYTQEQIKVWLRGLLTIAWADGHFDEDEQELIKTITQDELAPCVDFDHFEPVSPEELKQTFGQDSAIAENFLRMAVMVALADGVYSTEEDAQLHSLCTVLQLEQTVLDSIRLTLYNLKEAKAEETASFLQAPHPHSKLDPLKPARDWLDQLEVHDPRLARFVCKLIPPQCPFERDVVLFGRK
ncbi:MAG TPA: Mo-dependent nitrogenase C-terminal domain-containing protein, partial [Trichocoleus sp.]